ncbi:hypothetical protein [Clostridium intestinale]|uniref:Uncharacterized protein n=1 Tax=Clostridium intestinale URNW TaxID=1294142 RepID=U2PSA8_9CLOT|nr:hypothetical protein [Clostridium intestinale]ERK29345.1 hypothetical protein CINTURNW_3348 [Clostridium intestinale URNW]
MAEKIKLEGKELEDLSKEDDEKNIINIEMQEGDEIDGEVVRELISSVYDKIYSNIDKKTILINEQEGKKVDKSRKIIRGGTKRRTPAVDGEEFEIKRTYMMRRTTVKMLNQLKGLSDDVDIHMNTIIDIAIRHYFNSVIEEEKNELYLGKK